MEPINYLAQVADPFAQATQGLQLGAGMVELQQKQAAMVQQQQRQQLAAQEQARFFANQNPTMRDAARYASLLSPEQANAFRPFMEGITKEQQQSTLKSTGQLLSALQTNPQVFISQAKEKALAARNSGDEADATLFEQMAEAAADPQRGPGVVFKSLTARTAGIPGAKEFFETIDKGLSSARAEEQAPAELRQKLAVADKAESDAKTALETAKNAPERAAAEAALAKAQADKAKVDAEFARSNVLLEQEKKRADITKTESDILIAKEDNRIKALNATIARETNALRRQELQQKIDDVTEKRDSAKRDQQATLASAQADVDNFLNTATQVLNTPIEIINQATGPVRSRLPTVTQPVADFESLVETLGSQIFIAQIPKIKGAGALSEKEGDKLQASVQNLSLKQSPDQLQANVREAVRLLGKARTNLAERAGLPSTPRDVPAEGLTVRLPNGATATFPTKAAADAYKKAAGIQ
jgi:hypothetical protein